MDVKRHPRGFPGDEKGMVLVLGLLLVAVLSLVGTTAVMTSTTDMKINSNYKSGAQAFYIAEAGIERARAQLLTLGSTDLSPTLADRRGANNQLTDSTLNSTFMARFFANGAFVTDDVAYITQYPFPTDCNTCGYSVYLTNDATETGGVTSATDTNRKVTLTSFGQGPNNSLAVVQVVVKQFKLPNMLPPGAIVLPGPGISFQGGLNPNSKFDGKTKASVALTSDAAQSAVMANLTAIGNLLRYKNDAGLGASSIMNTSTTIDPAWNSVDGLEGLYRSLMSVAGTVTGTTSGETATTTTLTAAQVGTSLNRKIVVVNGNAVIDNLHGAGILVVTGQLTFRNNAEYKGLIMCIGQGKVVAEGWNHGDIEGALLVAKTRDASNNLLETLGNPTYDLRNDFETDVEYSTSEINEGLPVAEQRFIKQSWRKFF